MKFLYLLSQLQNYTACKIALLAPVETASPRLPSQQGPKSSIFHCRVVLQLALFLLAFSCLRADYVDLVANFEVDPTYLNKHLNDLGLSVRMSDLSEYHLLEKKPTFLQKWGVLKLQLPIIPANTAKIVFWNLTSSQIKKLSLSKLPKEKLVLFMMEPRTVLKKMYEQSSLDLFGRIYTLDDDLVDGIKFFKFYYPELKQMLFSFPSFEEKKLCTLIAGCKKSKWKGELYSERVKAIEFFESKPEGEFEFFGKGWEQTPFKSYRGAIENKLDVLKNYRFSICFENTRDMNGYVTEKIFDCFAAGCVPVYWGAPNVTDYIPKECFIDFRDFYSFDTLYAFLKGISQEAYEIYLQNIRKFLESEKAKPFSPSHFMATFREAIQPVK